MLPGDRQEDMEFLRTHLVREKTQRGRESAGNLEFRYPIGSEDLSLKLQRALRNVLGLTNSGISETGWREDGSNRIVTIYLSPMAANSWDQLISGQARGASR
jgi:hypothetical protein